MQFTYTLRPEDIREYVRWGASQDRAHIRTRDAISMWIFITFISFAGLLAYAQEIESRATTAAAIVLLPGIVIAINYWRKYFTAVADTAVKKFEASSMPGLYGQQSVSVNEAAITFSDAYATSTIQWNAFTALVELPKHIVLRRGSVHAHVIPRDTIAGAEVSTVISLMRKHVRSAA